MAAFESTRQNDLAFGFGLCFAPRLSAFEFPTTMNQPPPVPAKETADRRSHEPLWWVVALVVAAALARVAMNWNVPLPLCNFKRLTGAPCPFCGGTRALKSAAEFDLWPAFQFNPLVFLAGMVVIAWFGLWLIDRFLARPIQPRLRAWLARWPWWWIAGGLVLANWAYLIRTLE